MAGIEVRGFGVQPGTAGGLPLPSVPSAKYTFELGPEKAMFFPDRVNAEGKLRLNVCAATTYCTVFWLPFGRTARAVISNACFAVAGGFGLGPIIGGTMRLGLGRCAPSKYKGALLFHGRPLLSTSVRMDCSVAGVMRTHLKSGP